MAVYAVSDLHGCYDLFQQIKEILQPNDVVYMLGDCADRGPRGWDIIKEVRNDNRFIYIRGNHEDMLVDAMLGDKWGCFSNGGKVTFLSWIEDGQDAEWWQYLNSLPVMTEYVNTNGQTIVLCHAGCNPNLYTTDEDYIWDRYHFTTKWDESLPNTFVIHGHTPIPYMDHYSYWDYPQQGHKGAFWYSADTKGIKHKCNIDCGAPFTGDTVLLNLDTFEEIRLHTDNIPLRD